MTFSLATARFELRRPNPQSGAITKRFLSICSNACLIRFSISSIFSILLLAIAIEPRITEEFLKCSNKLKSLQQCASSKEI